MFRMQSSCAVRIFSGVPLRPGRVMTAQWLVLQLVLSPAPPPMAQVRAPFVCGLRGVCRLAACVAGEFWRVVPAPSPPNGPAVRVVPPPARKQDRVAQSCATRLHPVPCLPPVDSGNSMARAPRRACADGVCRRLFSVFRPACGAHAASLACGRSSAFFGSCFDMGRCPRRAQHRRQYGEN